MVISKGLGYGILAGALLLRVPQIVKILAAKSGDGISVASEVLSLVLYAKFFFMERLASPPIIIGIQLHIIRCLK